MSGSKKFILSLTLVLVSSFILAYHFIFEGFSTTVGGEIESGEKVILLFSASWCGSCKKQKPILDEVLQNHKNIKFFKIGSNLNKVRKKFLFEKYSVHGVPTLILFSNGKEVSRLSGVQSREVLEKAFSSLNQKESL